LQIKTDSQVVAGHIEKDYRARDLELLRYLLFLRDQEKHFEITQASIKTKQEAPKEIHIIQSEDWRAPIMAYLREHYEPNNEVDEVRMKH
jgi:hypothetical protein